MTDHSPDHAERAAQIDQLRQRLAEASAQPWVYRPSKWDDWGWIRGVERDDRDIGPFRPIVANAKDSLVRADDMDAHRRAGTDPFGPNALLIVEAVNALPWLLDLSAAALRGRDAVESGLAKLLRAAVKLMKHDGLCARIGGYGYCSCGLETVGDAVRAALDDTVREGEGEK